MEGSSKSAALFAQVRSAVVRQLAAQPAWEGLDALCQGKKYPDIIWPWLELTPRIAFAMEKLLSTYDLPGLDPESAVRLGLEEVAQSLGHELCWQDLHKLTPWRAFPPKTGSEQPGLSGDSDCVLATYSTPGFTHGCLRGPAMRYVWDLENRENSLWVLPFGASPPPGNAPYDDQLKRWTNCEYLPIKTVWEDLKPDLTLEDPTLRICHFEQRTPDHGVFRIMEMWPERDLDHIYDWVSQERARYWGMLEHSRERVLEIYDYLDSLPTHHPYLIYHGKKPVAVLQIYRPENEPLGRLYDSQPGDRGFHLLVAPPTIPVHGFTSAIMSLSVDFIFSNPAIDRIVAEPDCRNEKMLTLLERHGFHIGSSIEMPEKTARFVSLTRVSAQTV